MPNPFMPRKQTPKEWEIWEAWDVPFSDGCGEKDRPVIICRIDARTGIHYCFPVTSKPPGNYGKYLIKENKGTGFKQGNKQFVMYDLVELRRCDLNCRRGSLAEEDRDELLKKYIHVEEERNKALKSASVIDYSSIYSQNDVDRRMGRALSRRR